MSTPVCNSPQVILVNLEGGACQKLGSRRDVLELCYQHKIEHGQYRPHDVAKNVKI